VDWLAQLFQTNRIIVLTVYGQVFFVLGLAVALRSRRRSQLAIAGALPWLAAFGFVHGFVEWGYLFIPLQSTYLPEGLINALLYAQLVLKALSFVFLFEFGAELLRVGRGDPNAGRPATPEARGPFGIAWLRLVPWIAVGLWTVGTLATSAATGPGFAVDPSPWLAAGRIDEALRQAGTPIAVGDVLARYLLAIPGSAAVTLGLLRNAAALGPLARPPVAGALRLAAGAFGVYALLGGVIGMPAPFPPASLLNARGVLDLTGIPIEVLRSLDGLLIAIAIIRGLELFEQETDRALAESRRRELLLRERERIGRDLHDGIIQSIYASGLHLEELEAQMRGTGEPEAGDAGPLTARGRVRTVMAELNRIVEEIRSYIFDLRTASLQMLDPGQIVASVADELRANTLLAMDLTVEGPRPRLAEAQAEQLRQIVHEALSNVLRHAHARRVAVRLHATERELTLDIADDGAGYDPGHVADLARGGHGQGLRNMQRRAMELGATLDIRSAPGRGTALSLTMPVTPHAVN
jgi:signal transduction histidine kinase